LMNLPVSSSSGSLYALRDLATFTAGTGPTTLSRQNQQTIISVGANLQGRALAETVPDIQKALSGISLPAAVTWKFGGQQAQAQSAYSSLIFALIIGLIFIYMVLASQFGSFIHPFTVMAALPLAIIGSVWLMVATHTGLTVISMIGIIMMMGLATKNSILLVDFIIHYRKQGRDRTEAVLEAGPVRLRPIIMTSLAIILGMIPTAMAIGAAGSFRAPMAIAVVGGVFSSTLLSLVVVPVVYTIFDDALVAVKRLFRVKSQAVYQPEASGSLAVGESMNGNDETNLNGTSKRRGRWNWWTRNRS
jgi:HAE1 family hydrophobic/amphiphilic exporter-1